MKIKIENKPGFELEVDPGESLSEILKKSGLKNPDKYFVALVDGRLADLNSGVDTESEVKFLSFEEPEGKDIYRHSSSHVLAQAVKELYPDVQLGIGPAIEEGPE